MQSSHVHTAVSAAGMVKRFRTLAPTRRGARVPGYVIIKVLNLASSSIYRSVHHGNVILVLSIVYVFLGVKDSIQLYD